MKGGSRVCGEGIGNAVDRVGIQDADQTKRKQRKRKKKVHGELRRDVLTNQKEQQKIMASRQKKSTKEKDWCSLEMSRRRDKRYINGPMFYLGELD